MTEGCTIDGCSKSAARSGLCWGHYNGQRRGRAANRQLRQYANPARTFAEAMFAFTDAAAEDDRAYYRAWKRVYQAGLRYFGTKGTSRRSV